MTAGNSMHRGTKYWENDSCLPVLLRGDTSRRELNTDNQAFKQKLLKNAEICNGCIDSQTDDEEERIIINVSGKRFETYLTTLTRIPNTLLGDPAKLIHFYNLEIGEYFFDRHRKAFKGILYFYPNGIVERPVAASESLFIQEALFFELSQDDLQ